MRKSSFMNIGLLTPAQHLSELARPWKLLTFGVAMTLLLAGSLTLRIPDWDAGITLIMGCLAYVCAPWSVRVLLYAVSRPLCRRPGLTFASLLAAWFCVDGVYVLYHTAMGNIMLRFDNFCVSLPVYFLAGSFWLYAGTSRDFLIDLGDALLEKAREKRN